MRHAVALARFLALGMLLALAGPPGVARGQEAERYRAVPTRPGVSVPVALLLPEKPLGAVLLLPGGDGLIGIEDEDGAARIRRGGNFLVRTRQLFAARGLAVAVVDAPSVRREEGMGPAFRISEAHAEDLRALALYLRQATGHKPWLIGTSMGTISAAWGAERLGQDIAGVALTSSITRSGKKWGLSGRYDRAALNPGLASVAVPALVVAHTGDGCWATPPGDAPDLLAAFTASPRKELLLFEGGLPPKSEPCEARSAHGYFGIEERVVEAMVRFILDGR